MTAILTGVRRWLLRAMLCAGVVLPETGWALTVTPETLERADRAARALLAERDVPGAAVVVSDGDRIVLARGYGVADLAGGGAVTAETVFQLGSISKQFLAVLVLSLIEDGLLALDDPVTRHLSGFTQLPATLHVRHLLNHTSGLRELFTTAEAQRAYDDLSRTRAELATFVRQLPVDAPPGTRWSYSNTNYTILALLVEQLTGEPYERLLAGRFFIPLGLSSIRHCTPLPAGPGEARGHERHDGRLMAAAPENMEWVRGDGGLCGSARDVARWIRMLTTGRVVSPRLVEQMIAPTPIAGRPVADYGFGLSLVPLDGVRKIAHNGAMRGFSASAAYYPDAGLTIVVLANRGDVRTESVERELARLLLRLPAPAFAARDLPPEGRQRFTGAFDIGVFVVRIEEREGRLWIRMPSPGPSMALRYLGGSEFVGEDDPDALSLVFASEPAGADTLRLYMGAMHWYGTRVVERGGTMYGLIGKITAQPGQRDALAGILLEGTRAMPGCLSYVVAADPADADGLWITEVWDSRESHQASLQLPEVQAAIARGRPLIAGFSHRVETTPLGGVGLEAASP